MTEDNKPENQEEQKRRERRATTSTAFLALLIGLAYQEGVAPARESMKAHGVTLVVACLFLSFFFLGLATFLSGYTHLLVTPYRKGAWLLNFCIVTTEGVILIFMAGVASVEANQQSQEIGFLDYLFVFYVVDVSWVVIGLIQAVTLVAEKLSGEPHRIQSALRAQYTGIRQTWWAVYFFPVLLPAAFSTFLWWASNQRDDYGVYSPQWLVPLMVLIFIGFVTNATALNRYYYDLWANKNRALTIR